MASNLKDTEKAATVPSQRRGATARLADQVKGQTAKLTQQGLAKAAKLAEERKDGAVQTLDAVAGVVRNFAASTEGEFGSTLGGVVNRGADGIETIAGNLRDQSVGEMVDGTRSMIARHPGLAIGAASLVGFLAGRIAKAGLHQGAPTAPARRIDANSEAAA